MNIFNSVVDKHAPIKKVRVKARSSPWFTADLADLFNSRNRAWAQARRHKTPSHWLLFRQLRNRCTAALRKAKSEYYLHSINSSHNPGKLWKSIKSLTRNNSSFPTHIDNGHSILTDRKDICSAFNDHFAAAGHLFDLDGNNSDCNTAPQTELPPDTPPNFTISPFSLDEVTRTLLAMDTRKSTGADNLDAFFLKLSVPLITESITHIFNLTISTGTIPIAWKTASVLPLQLVTNLL